MSAVCRFCGVRTWSGQHDCAGILLERELDAAKAILREMVSEMEADVRPGATVDPDSLLARAQRALGTYTVNADHEEPMDSAARCSNSFAVVPLAAKFYERSLDREIVARCEACLHLVPVRKDENEAVMFVRHRWSGST